MDGLLVIDKPSGPTSHDVVARLRRVLRERRIGHTGTLDPLATGVLTLVIGRATRLARFMVTSSKSYRAVVRLGVRTDSGDLEGEPIGQPWRGALPDVEAIEAALRPFRGTFLQQPPAFSAKKIGGRRSYALARSARAAQGQTRGSDPEVRHRGQTPGSDTGVRRPGPVEVTVARLALIKLDGDLLTLDIECSAGFYVRSLADDLGQRLGTGGHLAALRRTRSGEFGLDDALALDEAERDPVATAARIIPLARLLTTFAAVTLTPEGMRSVTHGRELEPVAWQAVPGTGHPPEPFIRLLDSAGNLLGVAEPSSTPGLLHPSVVLM